MTALCLSLCACGGKAGTDNFTEEIKTEYSAAKSVTMIAEVTADYGKRVYQYKLRCICKDGEAELEVMEPEGIKGIKAHVSNGKTGLEYEGVTLDTGELFGDGFSPIDALPMMVEAWKGGFVEETWKDKVNGTQTVAVRYDLSEKEGEKPVKHTAWFDTESRLPVKAEILYDGYRVISCTFGNIIME